MNWFTQWAMEQINTSNTMTDRGLNTQGAHKTMNVLSLGMGVQSTALYLMSALGQLPRIDFAVFSDTGREMTETIRYLDWLLEWRNKHNGPEIIVKNEMNLFRDLLTESKTGFSDIPVHIQGEDGKPTILKRQCTYKYKIDVVNKVIREYYGIKPKARVDLNISIWQGISTDEAHRMSIPDRQWKTFVYPFIGYAIPGKGKWFKLDDASSQRMSRQDIKQWYTKHGFAVPPKSGCVFCPYHSDAYWDDMKKNHPADFADAVRIDEHIRNQFETKTPVYLHPKLQPLKDVVFNPNNSIDFGDCTGNCHV